MMVFFAACSFDQDHFFASCCCLFLFVRLFYDFVLDGCHVWWMQLQPFGENGGDNGNNGMVRGGMGEGCSFKGLYLRIPKRATNNLGGSSLARWGVGGGIG